MIIIITKFEAEKYLFSIVTPVLNLYSMWVLQKGYYRVSSGRTTALVFVVISYLNIFVSESEHFCRRLKLATIFIRCMESVTF